MIGTGEFDEAAAGLSRAVDLREVTGKKEGRAADEFYRGSCRYVLKVVGCVYLKEKMVLPLRGNIVEIAYQEEDLIEIDWRC